jgi:hypothetical protein
MRVNRDLLAAILATVMFLIVVFLGFWKTRGPSSQRLVRADEKRIQLLSQLANQINNQYRGNKQLPATLTDRQKHQFADPLSGQPPQYSPTPPSHYQLCATFATEGPKTAQTGGDFVFWTHSAGAKCFDFDASEPVPAAPYFYY